jgi:hypothetical protein
VASTAQQRRRARRTNQLLLCISSFIHDNNICVVRNMRPVTAQCNHLGIPIQVIYPFSFILFHPVGLVKRLHSTWSGLIDLSTAPHSHLSTTYTSPFCPLFPPPRVTTIGNWLALLAPILWDIFTLSFYSLS